MRILTFILLTLFTIHVYGQDVTPRAASNDRRATKVTDNQVKTKEKVKSEKQTKGTLVTKGIHKNYALVEYCYPDIDGDDIVSTITILYDDLLSEDAEACAEKIADKFYSILDEDKEEELANVVFLKDLEAN